MKRALALLASFGLCLAASAAPRKDRARSSKDSGRAVYQRHCATCHYTTARRKIGPGLKGLYRKPALEESGDKVTDDSVRALIENGAGAGEMPGFAGKITVKQMASLLAYLRKL